MSILIVRRACGVDSLDITRCTNSCFSMQWLEKRQLTIVCLHSAFCAYLYEMRLLSSQSFRSLTDQEAGSNFSAIGDLQRPRWETREISFSQPALRCNAWR